MTKMKVLIITNEMDPYIHQTEQAKFARAIPENLQENGFEVRSFMPRFGKINERKHRLHEVIRLSGINIPVGEFDNPMIIKVASLPSAKMQVYFVDNEDYFQRKDYLRDEDGTFFEDNDERTIFFNKGAIEILLKLGWEPDIIHCHGWMTGLIPLYARSVYKNEPAFKNSKFLFTIYENSFQEELGNEFMKKAHLNGKASDVKDLLKNPSCNELHKTGSKYADAVSFGSENVDPEVKSYVQELNKPLLNYANSDGDQFAEGYMNFYNQILDE